MRNYTVCYNLGKNVGRFRPNLTVKALELSDDYFIMCNIQAENLENAFDILNMNHPQALLDTVNALKDNPEYEYGLHTSMSVGDVLIETGITNRYWQCDRIGWKVIE